MSYPKASDEEERLEVLHSLSILDTAPDRNVDRIVELCQRVFGVEVASVTVIDTERQWFKSIVGLDICETSREVAFCNHTILQDEVFEVPDALEHPILKDNDLVTGEPHIRYYAGVPIHAGGKRLGALCLIDFKPRAPLTADQRWMLWEFARLVERELVVQRLLKRALVQLTGLAAS